MIKKLIIIFSLIFSMANSFALQKIFIFHINGINTNRAQAETNKDELNKTLNVQSNLIANNGQVDLLYNSDGNGICTLCNQLRDVFSQKHFENVNIDDYVKAYLAYRKLDIKPDNKEYQELKANIRNKYLEDPAFMGNNFGDILNQYHGKTVNTTHFNDYVASNNGGKPFVLLVPHSQGNLYANSLYQHLTIKEGYNQQNLSIFGVASPASQNLGAYISKSAYGNEGYITSNNDGVINSLRLLSNVASANFSIPKGGEFSGHGLIPTYLSNQSSRQAISDNLYNIVHYFWLSNIYSNFTQTINGGERKLSDGLSLVTMQDPKSTLSVAGIMANGKCLGNTPYFVTKHTKYDHEMGLGMQCASNVRGSINLNAKEFADTNTLKIRIASGKITQKHLYMFDEQGRFILGNGQHRGRTLKLKDVSKSYYNGIIGGVALNDWIEVSKAKVVYLVDFVYTVPPEFSKPKEPFENGTVGFINI